MLDGGKEHVRRERHVHPFNMHMKEAAPHFDVGQCFDQSNPRHFVPSLLVGAARFLIDPWSAMGGERSSEVMENKGFISRSPLRAARRKVKGAAA